MDADVSQARTILLDRLLAEAATMGEQARTHLSGVQHADPSLRALRTHHELGVIAACLGFSVAWLLEQKAVLAGERVVAAPTPVHDQASQPTPDPSDVDPAIAALGARARAFGLRIHRLAAN